MRIVDLQQQTKEEWRSGVMTRMKASAVNNATQLCMFEQWCDPGHGAPTTIGRERASNPFLKGAVGPSRPA